MEVFVDFGLFELFAASAVGALGRWVLTRKYARWSALALSIAAPLALLVLATGEAQRWVAALALGTSILNASMIVSVTRSTRPGEAQAGLIRRAS
jgi:hypothetical protein